ncbi:MAG TPA: thiamine pyrophosphate-dependent enzyme [Patescibacteria group bacterium]
MFAGLQQAIIQLGLPQEDIVVVYDIGCNGNMADFVNTYGIHSLHGRSIPTALGVKLANPKLKVIVIGGDGGIYGEGLNHLIAAARLDHDISVFVANNQLYSLTTGQTSPTTPKGAKTKSTPEGNPSIAFDPVGILHAVNPHALVETVDGSKPLDVISAMKKAIITPGFALVDLHQVCVTFGKQLG